ncbi:unnamed protein product [Dicrocoelium dendriticum]|nr:unnamed protein product [Dicrocoelium dendriticum]
MDHSCRKMGKPERLVRPGKNNTQSPGGCGSVMQKYHFTESSSSRGDLVHPPAKLLPPFPPQSPTRLSQVEQTFQSVVGPFSHLNIPQRERCKLPSLDYSKADLMGRAVIKDRSTVQRGKRRRASVDVYVETTPLPHFRCLLCGLDCVRGDLLYAHLLILRHDFAKRYGLDGSIVRNEEQISVWTARLTCCRCGRRWESEVECLSANQHGCVQQKAAYLSAFLAPNDVVKQGLPFLCLFCCTEPNRPNQPSVRCGRGTTGFSKPQPLKLHESAMRFRSKLHLVVHILCRHAAQRKSGTCAECPLMQLNLPAEEEGGSERSFWYPEEDEVIRLGERVARYRRTKEHKQLQSQDDTLTASSESETDTLSPCQNSDNSILKRQGLQALEKHIDEYHLPNFEVLMWYMLHSMPTRANSSTARKHAMYSCPICDLNNYRMLPHISAMIGEDMSKSVGDLPAKHCHITSNAMLQAHVACYHAGAKELDSLLELCQVCETTDFMRLSSHAFSERATQTVQGSLRHLTRAGHVARLLNQFNQCVSQGRLDMESYHASLDWSTVCLFCWHRYAIHLGDSMTNLLAQCRLQTHLVVQHGALSYESSYKSCDVTLNGVRPCGWCGETMRLFGEEVKWTS